MQNLCVTLFWFGFLANEAYPLMQLTLSWEKYSSFMPKQVRRNIYIYNFIFLFLH